MIFILVLGLLIWILVVCIVCGKVRDRVFQVAFALLVLIIILAALLVAFALAGCLKTAPMHDESKVCLRSDCIGIDTLPISLSGDHCYVLTKNFTIDSEVAIEIRNQHNIDLCYNNCHIDVIGPIDVIHVINSTDIRVHNMHNQPVTPPHSNSLLGICLVILCMVYSAIWVMMREVRVA